MKPEVPLTDMGPEQHISKQGPCVERVGDLVVAERGIEKNAEPKERKSELSAAAADAGSSLMTVIPTPVSTGQAVKDDGSVTIGDTNPIIANDDDLIEKEWVDRAKKIVTATRDDPYQRDEEVGKLQVDYLKKRFGRELGGSK